MPLELLQNDKYSRPPKAIWGLAKTTDLASLLYHSRNPKDVVPRSQVSAIYILRCARRSLTNSVLLHSREILFTEVCSRVCFSSHEKQLKNWLNSSRDAKQIHQLHDVYERHLYPPVSAKSPKNLCNISAKSQQILTKNSVRTQHSIINILATTQHYVSNASSMSQHLAKIFSYHCVA